MYVVDNLINKAKSNQKLVKNSLQELNDIVVIMSTKKFNEEPTHKEHERCIALVEKIENGIKTIESIFTKLKSLKILTPEEIFQIQEGIDGYKMDLKDILKYAN